MMMETHSGGPTFKIAKSDSQRTILEQKCIVPGEGTSKITCGSLTITNKRAFSGFNLRNLHNLKLQYKRFHSVKGHWHCTNVR